MADVKPLKLRARSVADMDVLAACLQDALVPLRDVTYRRSERRFIIVLNRFMWEQDGQLVASLQGAELETVGAGGGQANGGDAAFEESAPRPFFYRTNSALSFDAVRTVTANGINLADRNQILSLLTIATEPRRITLHFSGGQALRLGVSAIKAHLRDLGEPWPTPARPMHED